MDKNIIEVIQEIYCLLCDMRYPVFVHQLTNWEADRIEDDITAKTFHDYCYQMQLVWCTAEHKDLCKKISNFGQGDMEISTFQRHLKQFLLLYHSDKNKNNNGTSCRL